MTRRALTYLRRALLCAPLLATGCDDAPPDPSGPGEGGQAPTSDPIHRPPPAPSAKRTVIERDPFGNVAAAQNLLWDGDFEWTSPFTDQYGWIEPPQSPTLSDVVVGPACRSGLKCARVKKGGDIIGIAVGSSERPLMASVWTRFELAGDSDAPACSLAVAIVFDLGSFDDVDEDVALAPETSAPDANGWCKHSALLPLRAHKPYLYVTNESEQPLLVDDAVLVAADPAVQPHPAAGRAPSAAMHPRIDRARAAARAVRLPADGKPNAAREALERHKAKQRHGAQSSGGPR